MIDWNAKCVFVMVAVLAGLWPVPVHCQETRAMMRWKNGDILVGKLLEGKSGQIRWSSPVFASALVVDSQALESIMFPGVTERPTEAFRIATVTGDVFVADLVGSDDKTFQLSSKRYGRVQVNRNAVTWLNRRIHANLIFDGSQISNWDVDLDGPVKESSYKLYAGDWIEEDEDGFPVWSQLCPIEIGRLPNGYLDVDLPRFRDRFAMLFEGRIEIAQSGEYYCGMSADEKARMFIDGTWVAQAEAEDVAREEFEAVIDTENRSKVKLSSGSHSLRVEYFNSAGHTRLNAWISGPDSPYLSLDGINKGPGWHGGPGGHPQSTRPKADLSTKINLPKQFEIDLELMSSANPQFVVALGHDTLDTTSNHLLRLETWADELVVAQDTVSEPVMTFAKGQRRVHLRLVYDGDTDELQVFDSSGDRRGSVKGMQLPTGESMIHVRNRGEDLAVHGLRVYSRSTAVAGQAIDLGKSRVRLVDGEVIYGHLTVAEDGAYVVDQDGTRRGVDLDEVDCISGPGSEWDGTCKMAELVYADGEVVGGGIERVNSDRVVLRTAFSTAPVTCSLVGASFLRFGSPAENTSPSRHSDRLFCALGQLHGQLFFDLAGSPLSWKPEGDAPPVGLAVTGGARIERNDRAVAKDPVIDEKMYPCVLHLRNGEIIPCRVSSYNRKSLGFQSPFLSQRRIDVVHVKAIEFKPVKKGGSSHAIEDWLRETLGTEPDPSGSIDPIKLDHALTVPRSNRNRPPTHILVARNGDLMRGTLLGISESSVHFESKLRERTIPIDRLACVVCVSEPDGDGGGPSTYTADLTDSVRARLAQGTILMFDPILARDGILFGRSAMYGEMTVPVASVEELNLGGLEQESFPSRFKEWVAHPAQEPKFTGPLGSPINAPPPEPTKPPDSSLNIDGSRPGANRKITEPQVVPDKPALGQVRIDVKDRSLRFPIAINQRSGPVEYALVTEQGKTHESVFRTDAEPTHIHLGLLLLGATPSYVPKFPIDPAQELPGESVHIDVTWTDGGVDRSRPLSDFVVTTHNAERLTRGPWVYNGSVLTDHGLGAQATGSIVSVWVDANALINNPRLGREDDELHHANPKAFPVNPVEFEMVIRLIKEEGR